MKKMASISGISLVLILAIVAPAACALVAPPQHSTLRIGLVGTLRIRT
jgi:hypothetical protein